MTNRYDKSWTGKAWDFVQTVISKHDDIEETMDLSVKSDEAVFALSNLNLIGEDEMILMVERLIETQMNFAANGKECHVDIGFHFTTGSNLDNIREHGLLTKADRDERSLRSKHNGSTYGDGVYTGSNPFAYRRYGNVGIMVVRLRGKSQTLTRDNRHRQQASEQGPDTVIVQPSSFREMVVLSRSCQCFPLATFDSSLLNHSVGREALWNSQQAFQDIIDRFFNDGTKTTVRPWQNIGNEMVPAAVTLTPKAKAPTIPE